MGEVSKHHIKAIPSVKTSGLAALDIMEPCVASSNLNGHRYLTGINDSPVWGFRKEGVFVWLVTAILQGEIKGESIGACDGAANVGLSIVS